jgi:uncharacterized protein (DUF1697 family)
MNKKYVALLRGINVGGNKKVSMDTLKNVMTDAGFANVETLLNSGNVMFEAKETDLDKLTGELCRLFSNTFGFDIPTLVRTEDEIRKLIQRDPFKNEKKTDEVHFYITFLSEEPLKQINAPYKSTELSFQILESHNDYVVSIVNRDAQRNSTDYMQFMGIHYGKKITTRNWNTVKKLIK